MTDVYRATGRRFGLGKFGTWHALYDNGLPTQRFADPICGYVPTRPWTIITAKPTGYVCRSCLRVLDAAARRNPARS